MNYDQTNMAAGYDAGRAYSPQVLAYWLDVISRSVPKGSVSEILDLGCGTGRYSNGLADYFQASVVGIDPSEKMLAEAQRKASARVRYERASAESLPLRDAAVDMFLSRWRFITLSIRTAPPPNAAVCSAATAEYAYVQARPSESRTTRT